MFVLNFIELSAAVCELSCVRRKNTGTKTIQTVATVRTVIMDIDLFAVDKSLKQKSDDRQYWPTFVGVV